MKRHKIGKRLVAVATAAIVVIIGGCADDDTDGGTEAATPSAESTRTTTGAPTTTARPRTTLVDTTTVSVTTSTTVAPATTSAPSTTEAAPITIEIEGDGAELGAAMLQDVLDGLTVEDEPRHEGYERELFRHWTDTNGSGCDARQDALAAQALYKPQHDLTDPCLIVEGDWYSLFDGLVHSGSPSEFDVDHVVALAEAWDSGAAQWSSKRRENFANDPMNLLAVAASANRSKGDQDAGEWRPDRQDAWCVTGAMTVQTKDHYNLTVDEAERDGLTQMISTCDGDDWRTVPGIVVTEIDNAGQRPPVTTLPNIPTTPPPPTTIQPTPDGDSDCEPGQININTADEDRVQGIIHIGPDRAGDLIANRPYDSIHQLSRIRGIANSRIADIVDQGLACV